MDYISRHVGPNQDEQQVLLDALGYESIDALIAAAVPGGILADKPLDLPVALSEYEAQDRLRELAGKNQVLRAFYGQGFNSTLTPPVIRRGVVEDAGWYTAYTPYQAEISQGRLEALLNFQTMVQDLTGLDIANASLLDEASAAAEAVGLMARVVKKGRRVLLDSRLHPQVIKVASERARAIDLEVEVANLAEGVVGEDLVGAVFAYPGTEGDIVDPRPVIEAIHERGGLVAVDADILAKCLLAARTKNKFSEQFGKVTVDSPIPYLLTDLNSILVAEMGKLDRAGDTTPYQRLKNKLDELDKDLDGEGMRTQMVINLDPRSRVREGDVGRFVFDPGVMHVFDPETGDCLTRDDAKAAEIARQSEEDRQRGLERARAREAANAG